MPVSEVSHRLPSSLWRRFSPMCGAASPSPRSADCFCVVASDISLRDTPKLCIACLCHGCPLRSGTSRCLSFSLPHACCFCVALLASQVVVLRRPCCPVSCDLVGGRPYLLCVSFVGHWRHSLERPAWLVPVSVCACLALAPVRARAVGPGHAARVLSGQHWRVDTVGPTGELGAPCASRPANSHRLRIALSIRPTVHMMVWLDGSAVAPGRRRERR